MPNSNIVVNNKAIYFLLIIELYFTVSLVSGVWIVKRPDRVGTSRPFSRILSSYALGEIEHDKNVFMIIVHIVAYKHISKRNLCISTGCRLTFYRVASRKQIRDSLNSRILIFKQKNEMMFAFIIYSVLNRSTIRKHMFLVSLVYFINIAINTHSHSVILWVCTHLHRHSCRMQHGNQKKSDRVFILLEHYNAFYICF